MGRTSWTGGLSVVTVRSSHAPNRAHITATRSVDLMPFRRPGICLLHTVQLRLSNGSRLSCGALKKDSFHNLRAPPASSAC